ncbi:MAG: metal-dependent hydrolase [Haloarculaceae archaeon]
MWPWEHLALGYLAVSVAWRVAGRRVDGPTAVWLAVGTQFPDLVDKGLAWGLDVLPAARSLGHSVFTMAPVSLAAVVLARRRGRPYLGGAFAIGYAMGLAGDAVPRLIEGYYSGLTFLVWPLLPLPPSQGTAIERLKDLLLSPELHLATVSYRTAILFFVVAVWADDGYPGVVDLYRYFTLTRPRPED